MYIMKLVEASQKRNIAIVTNSLHFWSITTTKYVLQQFHLFLELDTHTFCSLFVSASHALACLNSFLKPTNNNIFIW